VRNGIPRQTALEAITINPARALGLDSRLGSIEAGKAGNVVVYSGDPLDFNSWVEFVYIDGVRAYDRQKDARLEELLKLEKSHAKPEPKKPEGGEAEKPKPKDDAEKDKPEPKKDAPESPENPGGEKPAKEKPE
jgi:adenine deaminase